MQGSRSARDKDGRTIWVDKNTTYEEWAGEFLKSESGTAANTPDPNTYKIGTLEHPFYNTLKEITTKNVVLTEDRANHIIERRGLEFFNKYNGEFMNILNNPDYIFNDRSRENTLIIAKQFKEGTENINLVLSLSVDASKGLSNSIITAIFEGNERFTRRVRTNKNLLLDE